MSAMETAMSFIYLGDEFVAAYSQIGTPGIAPIVLMGHTVELYLKGALLAAGCNTEEVARFRHDVDALLRACQERDPAFPVRLSLRPAVLHALRATGGLRMHERLSDDDQAHFSKYSNLYYAAFAQGDLKYWGTAVRRDVKLLTYIHPWSGAWLAHEFFDPIREYLGIPKDIGQMIREKAKHELPGRVTDSFLGEYDLLKQKTARDDDSV
jgi:hypothetical protein